MDDDLSNDMSMPSTSNTVRELNGTETRKLAIQGCLNNLVHTCQCRDDHCPLPSCHKMKRVVIHAKECKRKTSGGCKICKQLITLCCYHAKNCEQENCPVPFCLNIKRKLCPQQVRQRLEESQLLRRRLQLMMQIYVDMTDPYDRQIIFTENLQLFRTQPQEIMEIMRNRFDDMMALSHFTPEAT